MAKGHIQIEQELCKGCDLCITFCPQGEICVSEKLNAAGYLPAMYGDNQKCTGCAVCALVCPEVAIEVYLD